MDAQLCARGSSCDACGLCRIRVATSACQLSSNQGSSSKLGEQLGGGRQVLTSGLWAEVLHWPWAGMTLIAEVHPNSSNLLLYYSICVSSQRNGGAPMS